jgi:hypothetical protein
LKRLHNDLAKAKSALSGCFLQEPCVAEVMKNASYFMFLERTGMPVNSLSSPVYRDSSRLSLRLKEFSIENGVQRPFGGAQSVIVLNYVS